MTPSTTGREPVKKPAEQENPIVLICGDSRTELPDQDSGGVARIISRIAGLDVRVSVVEALCSHPGRIRDVIQGRGSLPLVLGVCRGEYSRSDLRSYAKKAGAHPLGVQLVELKGRRFFAGIDSEERPGDPLVALAGAAVRIAAAPAPSATTMKPVLLSADGRVSRRSLLTLPPLEYVGVPAIRRDACMASEGCSLCARACPHDALVHSEDSVSVDRTACLSCGICVSACPQRAIELPGNSVQELEAQVETLVKYARGSPIVFSCDKSQEPPSEGWHVVPVACAGMVPVSALAAALNGGAASVAIRQCSSVCNQRAGTAVAGKINFMGELLDTVGDDRSRVLLLTPADQNVMEAAPAASPTVERKKESQFFGVSGNWAQLGALAGSAPAGSVSHPFAPTGRVEFNSSSCTTCGTCAVACPTNAIVEERNEQSLRMVFDPSRCVACGECVANCPEVDMGAIRMVRAFRLGPTVAMPTYGSEDANVACTKCGKVFTTTRVLERLEQVLGDDYSHKHMGELCSDCRGLPI